MVKLGINIIPNMPAGEVVDLAVGAEALGYEYLILADEGFMQDVYILLGAVARETHTMKLAPCTNGYTRHPAVTAAAVASLNDLSGGRAFATLIAGGSVVLNPMNIPREAPLSVARDTVEILRRLWRGERVSYQGKRYGVTDAQISMGNQGDIPIWIAPRGEKMCLLTGELADGALMMVKADLGEGLELVAQGSQAGGRRPLRVFLDRIAFTPKMIEDTSRFFPNVVADTPERQLKGFMTDDQIQSIRAAINLSGAEAARQFITLDMLKGYKIIGTPQECSQTFRQLVDDHQLDVMILNIVAGGLEQNLAYLNDARRILAESGRLAA
ncbi:MAG: LLM class flavin-dependent oxidoreductase [Anaerolineae bacterium]|nr:LLM class flavin-dependent oxidoreductase [Anaerolineae bacterium]